MANRPLESLSEIGTRHGCDKFTVHDYAPIYEMFLAKRRCDNLCLLEIGVGGEGYDLGGASLKTWYDYFPNAKIVGIDIYAKSELDNDRIITAVCDQADQHALQNLVAELGPFDVVIDDGSHRAADVVTSLFVLFHGLKPGGLYFLEDLQTSYWSPYGGSSIAPECHDTAVRWLKLAIDIANRGEFVSADYFALRSGFEIDSVHVFHNIGVLVRQSISDSHRSVVLTSELRDAFLAHDLATNGDLCSLGQRLFRDPGRLASVLRSLSTLLSTLSDTLATSPEASAGLEITSQPPHGGDRGVDDG